MPSFISLENVWQILESGGGGLFDPDPWAAPKRPILNRLKSSTKHFTKAATERGPNGWWEKPVCKYGQILGKSLWKTLYISLFSFYLLHLFLLLLPNCIPYGTEVHLGLQISDTSKYKINWQFSTCFNFHVYFLRH